MRECSQLEQLLGEIRLLENQVRALRYGRRVLMNLLRFSEQHRLTQVADLERQIQALKNNRSSRHETAPRNLSPGKIIRT